VVTSSNPLLFLLCGHVKKKKKMIREAIGSLLHRCSKIKAFRHGISLHAAALKMGFQSVIIIANHTLNMYAKCGSITSARRVFDEMSGRNLVSWSAMISDCDQVGEHTVALDLFSKMRLVPNEYIFASVISACASLVARAGSITLGP
jgi:pentatricopeptide repeat protein